MNKSTVYKLVTFILLFLLSFTIRLIALYQTPYANGWDGYYYIMQMYTFIENGAMRAPDYSIVYSFYIFLYYITHDYIFAFKFGSALLAATFTISVYFFSYYLVAYKHDGNLGSKAFYLALFVAIFSIFSPTLTYFTAQFPKNLLGIIFLLWFIYFINKQHVFCLILFFALSFLTHRMSAALAVTVLIISLLKGKHFWVLIAVSLVGVIGLSFLPGILHASDIERFRQVIDLNFPPLELIRYFGTDRLSILWIIEIIFLFGIFVYFSIWLINRFLASIKSRKIYIQLFVILLILSLPFFQFQQAGLGFRFYLSFTLLAVLLLPFLVRFFSHKLLIILSLSVVFLSIFSYRSYEPEQLDPPYQDYFQVAKQLKKNIEKETSLVIAHQGLAQIIIISDLVNATNWQPMQNKNYDKTARIAVNIPFYYYKKYLTASSLDEVTHLYKSYYLMPENVWRQFGDNVNKSNNHSLKEKLTDWYNPSAPKPQYLLKGRKKDYTH